MSGVMCRLSEPPPGNSPLHIAGWFSKTLVNGNKRLSKNELTGGKNIASLPKDTENLL